MPIHRLEEEVFPKSKPPSGQLPSLSIDHDLGLSPDLKDRNLEVKVDPEQPWTAEEKEGPKRKTILIIAGTTALLAALLFLTFKFTKVPLGAALTSSARLAQNTSPSLMETGNVTEIRTATQATVRGFMEASNYTDRCNFVGGGSELEERMREEKEHLTPHSGSPPARHSDPLPQFQMAA